MQLRLKVAYVFSSTHFKDLAIQKSHQLLQAL